jgi:uncharacterized protein YbaP (TraB family)
MSRRLLALLALLTLAPLAHAQTAPEADDRDPLLYVLEDGDSRVYLLGSIHFLDADAYPLPADVEAAYDDADAVAFEIDMRDVMALQTAMLARAQYADGRTLADAMSEAQIAKLDAVLGRFGASSAAMATFEPWAVQLSLVGMGVQAMGYSPETGVDAHFLARATADEKPVLALETAESQFDIFDTMPEEAQVEMLVETLDEWDEQADIFERLVAAWETGDEPAMQELLNDLPESIAPALLRDRNAAWVPQIEAYLAREGEDVLVVVGAGHLTGADSVTEMLRAKGYALTRQ